MRLDGPALDAIAVETRETLLVDVLRRQIAFMRGAVPFWRERLANVAFDEGQIEKIRDLARYPIFSKDELRAIRPAALLPNEHVAELSMCRWTSGTTGRPTVNFWTETDWAAAAASVARMLGRQAPAQAPRVFNGYSQAHLTGSLYHDALRRLGGVVFDRSHHAEEVFSMLAQTELFDFDTLVLPERTTSGKAIGLADVLGEDPTFLTRHGVQWWIGSSGTFSPATVKAVHRDGVASVSNLYGSSEFGMFAISCARTPGDFHVAQGHVLVEIVDGSGSPVDNGRAGSIVVTHLSGMDRDGSAQTYLGSQLLRLAVGDAATFVSDVCTCGLTTPRLRAISRL